MGFSVGYMVAEKGFGIAAAADIPSEGGGQGHVDL